MPGGENFAPLTDIGAGGSAGAGCDETAAGPPGPPGPPGPKGGKATGKAPSGAFPPEGATSSPGEGRALLQSDSIGFLGSAPAFPEFTAFDPAYCISSPSARAVRFSYSPSYGYSTQAGHQKDLLYMRSCTCYCTGRDAQSIHGM